MALPRGHAIACDQGLVDTDLDTKRSGTGRKRANPAERVESKLLVRGIETNGTKALDGPGQLEGLVSARTWGFKSPLRHQKSPGRRHNFGLGDPTRMTFQAARVYQFG